MSESRKRRQGSGLRSRTGSKENLQHRNGPQQHGRSKMNSGQGKGNFQRQSSYDSVRKIVQEEGRTARNLIQFSVPIAEEQQYKQNLKGKSQERKPRSSSGGKRGGSRDDCSIKDGHSGHVKGVRQGRRTSSGGRKDLRARYWAFLFENLRRAVDEIYQTCETDESVVECKEVIMMLTQCTRDFQSLIQRLNLMKAYETAEVGQKPTSIAWEVRKSSPGKGLTAAVAAAQGGKEHLMPSTGVVRSLNFSTPAITRPGNSWADKVKGAVPSTSPSIPPGGTTTCEGSAAQQTATSTSIPDVQPLIIEEDDQGGWETVQRGGRAKNRNSGSSNSIHLISRSNSEPSTNMSDDLNNSPDRTSSAVGLTSSANTSAHTDVGDSRRSPLGDVSLMNSQNKQLSYSHDSLKENQPLKEQTQKNLEKDGWLKPTNGEELDQLDQQLDIRDIEEHQQLTEPQLEEMDASEDAGDEDLDSAEELSRLDDALASALQEEDKLAEQLEAEQDRALESAMREEQNYLDQIAKEENRIIEIDSEPEELGTTLGSSQNSTCNFSEDEASSKLMDSKPEERMSWADIMEEVDQQETRTPGRVVHMHEKLSSPSRKRSPTESRKRHEEKQAKAEAMRKKLLHEKAERLSHLTGKVEEVREWKEELLRARRHTIECKMQRADEKRRIQLKQTIRKAHQEETKANEIAFINTLEAQNKRHDIITKHQESEARLADIQEERQRKHEEKAAKEAAVEERRKALEAERVARLHEMQERRRQRETEFEQRQHEREKERIETARAKEREREERIAALNAQQQAHIEELQKKIQLKQDESIRRHKENLDQIREKAFDLSVFKHSTEDHSDAPGLAPYERKKFCAVCNVMIPSEVYLSSHLRGKKHQAALSEKNDGQELSKIEIGQFNLKHIQDAPTDKADPRITSDKERQKALKKRCKKLRQRMTQRGGEYENSLAGKQQLLESEHRAKLQKLVKDINKYVQSQDRGPWPQNRVSALDRSLGEIGRIIEKSDKNSVTEQNALRGCGGLNALCAVLQVIDGSTSDLPPVIPTKSLVHACNVMRLACKGCYDNCHYLLFGNKIGTLIDLLAHQINLLIPDNFSVSGGECMPADPLATALIQALACILTCLSKNNPASTASEASANRTSSSGDAFKSRSTDCVSYVVSIGLVDRLNVYFSNIRSSISDDSLVAEFLQHSTGLLTALTKLISGRSNNIFEAKKPEDTTQLIATFRTTDLVGIVSLLYGMLLHSGAPRQGEGELQVLPTHSVNVTIAAIRMLNCMATLDLQMLQGALGEEGTWLEFRHIASYLLMYCTSHSTPELLHEVILCVGYFTVLNHDNQATIQTGQTPTALQQLCALPFQYFSDPRLTNILFPTLISCCYQNDANRDMLQQELSSDLLANFIEEKELEAQQATLNSTTPKKTKVTDSDDEDDEEEKEADRMSLMVRFPVEEFTNAQTYFKST